jgi:branched-chain amino acid transport system substrate-binding protein
MAIRHASHCVSGRSGTGVAVLAKETLTEIKTGNSGSEMMDQITNAALTRRALLAGASVGLISSRVWAQRPAEIKVGLLVPISGMYARPGTVMREGAEMAVDHINAQGGIKALDGATLKLVVLDCGDTTEKAKNAAQRMVSQEPDLVAASAAYLSSFTLAVTEVTERANLPVLTLSYSDLITDRGFKYVFQTSATAASQARQALPQIVSLAETASGQKPKTVAIITDNTAASIASAKSMREGLLAANGLQLIVDETFTPPLADATSLVQKIRSAKPDLLFFLPTVISDAKLLLEKMSEFGMGQGKIPTISFGIAIAEPDMLQTVNAELLQGVLTCVASWGAKGHEALIAELKARYKEPWMTQNAVSTYGDMWVIKDALEKAGKAERIAVADALRTMDGGPSKYYPLGEIKFDERGRRVGAGMTIVQWQSGVPVTVFPPQLALAQPFWPKS